MIDELDDKTREIVQLGIHQARLRMFSENPPDIDADLEWMEVDDDEQD